MRKNTAKSRPIPLFSSSKPFEFCSHILVLHPFCTQLLIGGHFKWIAGFRSVLAHALKYTKKLPSSTPEKLAELEFVLKGTRRVALLGAHYGVTLKPDPRPLKCPSCGNVVNRIKGLGLVPLSEVSDLPDVVEEELVREVVDIGESPPAYEEVRAP